MIALLVLGCSPEQSHQGVLVGNPGEGTVQTARATGGTFQSGSVYVSQLRAFDCNDNAYTLLENVYIDLLGSSRFALPEQDLCVLEMVLGSPLSWVVESDGGTSFDVNLEVGDITVISGSGFSTGGQSLVLQLGQQDWLNQSLIKLAQDINDNEELLEILVETTALYADADADSIPDDESAPLAVPFPEDTGKEWTDDPDDEAAGCKRNEGDVGAAVLALPLLLLGWRRRESVAS